MGPGAREEDVALVLSTAFQTLQNASKRFKTLENIQKKASKALQSRASRATSIRNPILAQAQADHHFRIRVPGVEMHAQGLSPGPKAL